MSKKPDPAEAVRLREASDVSETESTFHLIERHRSGDPEALDRLFARYLVPFTRWASGRLPQWARDLADTQDLVQETLLQTFNRMDVFEPAREGAFQAYLRQALFNRIRDEIRRCGRRPGRGELDSQQEDERPTPLEEAIGREASDRYEKALASLKPEEREAIIVRVELGFSYEEMAIALEKPTPDAARKAAQRALVRLAEEMGRAEKG
jgi:RNA polymerase sigma factor (sigma-70 family)